MFCFHPGGLEFAIARRQGHTPRLSVEFLNWAANKVCGENEDGGFFSDMWNGYSRYGICAASEFLYQSNFEVTQSSPPEALADAKKRLGLGLQPNWIKEWDVKTGLTAAQFGSIKNHARRGMACLQRLALAKTGEMVGQRASDVRSRGSSGWSQYSACRIS